MTKVTPVSTDDCAAPAGHYSQGIIANGMLYTSGMLAVEPRTGRKLAGDIEEQARVALANIDALLTAAGTSRDQVVKCTCYISDISLWDRVNTVYADFFGTHRPARSIVPTNELHYGFLIEIDCIAIIEAGCG